MYIWQTLELAGLVPHIRTRSQSNPVQFGILVPVAYLVYRPDVITAVKKRRQRCVVWFESSPSCHIPPPPAHTRTTGGGRTKAGLSWHRGQRVAKASAQLCGSWQPWHAPKTRFCIQLRCMRGTAKTATSIAKVLYILATTLYILLSACMQDRA